jgi:hypothetical protein
MRKATFIWRYGIRGFGIPVAIVASACDYLSKHGWALQPLFSPATLASVLIGMLVGAFAGGYVWGLIFWWFVPQSSGSGTGGSSKST